MTVAPTVTAPPVRPVPPASGANEPRRPISIGLVNNMPDSAFAETEAQFTRLLTADGSAPTVELRRYAMASVERGAEMAPLLASYADANEIYDNPPDGLILTGTEPRYPDLRDEPYWDELSRLLTWSQSSIGSVLLSCLAAHASVLAVDGVERTPLPTKCFGVFPQQVHSGSDLARGLGAVAFPHSRFNEVRTEELRRIGYEVLAESSTGGWTVATRQVGDSVTVMFQGHPEYSPDTLLREYRRDVRRFLTGEREVFPEIPGGYLNREGEELLAGFRDAALADPHGIPIESFPFDHARQHVTADWQEASQRLAANWLARVDQSRASAGR